MLKNFGYSHLVDSEAKEEEGIPKWIRDRNNRVLENMTKRGATMVNDKTLVMNVANEMLRRKTKEFPFGRTGLRFGVALKGQVTVVGKSAFKSQA